MKEILSKVTSYHLKRAYLAQLEQFIAGTSDVNSLELVKRVERAYEILTRDERYTIEHTRSQPHTFVVKGPNDSYTVVPSKASCTCPDAERYLCKHRLVIKLILDAVKLMKVDTVHVEIGG